MRILMLTPYLPYPPSSGGQIRSYNLIKQLSKKHRITLCSLIKYDEEKKYVVELEKFCEKVLVFKRAERPWTLSNILRTGFSSFPFLVIRNFSGDEKKTVRKLLETQKFDIIHAETFYVSPHIPKTNIPIALVDQTIEYEVYLHYVKNFKWPTLRPILFLDVLKIKFWETYYWKRASKVVAVSLRDAGVMKKLVKGLKVEVVPNGVGEDLMEQIPIHPNKTILFMGNYAWLQNIEAARILARKIHPLILKKLAGVKILIAGQNTEKVENLKGGGVTLKNLKIDDIEGVKTAYRTSGILLAPLYGPGGTRLKILGAMASKLPVITTSIGIEGIDAEDKVSVLVADSPDALAEMAIKLLQDENLYKKIAENARELIEEKYSYESIAEKLSQIYEELGKTNN